MTRRLCAAAVVLFGVLAFSATAASAVEETIGSCVVEEIESATGPSGSHGAEAVEEIINLGHADGATSADKSGLEKLQEDLEDCLDAPNPILPEINEIIWGGAAFVVLLVLMRWKLFPVVKRAMDARSAKIQEDLDGAERERAEAAQVKASYEAELADARAEAARILEEAREQAAGVRADLQTRAEADIAEMRERAAADVEASKRQAVADLERELSDIALGAAEAVLGRSLADRSTQAQLVEDYISGLGDQD